MKGEIDLREIQMAKLRLSRRNLFLLVTALVVLGAGALTWRYLTHPPQAWLVRWRLDGFLKKQAHTRNFKVDFAFPPKAEMAKPEKSDPALKIGSRTGKGFEALREEYLAQKIAAVGLERTIVRSETELQENAARLDTLTRQTASAGAETNLSNVESNMSKLRDRVDALRKTPSRRAEWREKEDAITPIEEDLWEFQRTFAADAATSQSSGIAALTKARSQFTDECEKKLGRAPSYDEMYKIIGQELFVVKGLLASGNPEHRKQGVTLALAASRHATAFAVNGAVAARICEGYVLPNLDLANETNRRSPFNEENLLRQCADIFERNYEFNNVVRTYQIFLTGVKNADRADWARAQMGQAHEQAGEVKQALEAYREIRNTNNFRNIFLRTIPRLEKDSKG